MKMYVWRLSFLAVLSLTVAAVNAEDQRLNKASFGGLTAIVNGDTHALALDDQAPFHTTANLIQNERLVEMPNSAARLVTWDEITPDGDAVSYYAVSLDGREIDRLTSTSYVLKLRHGDFDPLRGAPAADAAVTAVAEGNLYIVQFITQPLEEFRAEIAALGGKVYKFLSNHAHFVEMTPAVRDAVAALPYVRWVGPVPVAYKLDEGIIEQLRSVNVLRKAEPAGKLPEPRLYSIMCNERGVAAQGRVSAAIRGMGGTVHGTTPRGFRLEATLSLEQVQRVAALDDVMFIDPKGQIEIDMDIVREIGGANYIETIAGYTGAGVRAEVADTELDVNHVEWSAPPIIHRAGSDIAHGTSVYGILFAQGVDAQARGLIPDGVGIFACSTNGLLGGGTTRYTHTSELVDPFGPYRAVLQTNSTGDSRTTQYTTISAEMDDMLFLYDIVLTQSQSNAGDQMSRPQAWAKNIISGGAVNHYDTLTRGDDCWCYTGSIGPASDGRVKPDLCFFYDDTYTASSGGNYTQFGGTSGATPSIAGHVCLFFQMWCDGLFGNEVDPGGDVFDNRAHMTTAKAVMINTANQYPFSGGSADLTRVHQGWGMPDLAYLYDMRDDISILDETELLGNMQSAEYVAFVEEGVPQLRVTMVYADTMGVPSASEHRINDLTLRVVSPGGVTYWGNNGLLSGNWSTSGGSPNTIDTVENVFIQNPQSGVWSVTVFADEVNEDTHPETPELDADFALVVSGGFLATCTSDGRIMLGKTLYACEDEVTLRVVDCDLNTDDELIETVEVEIVSDTETGGETVLLTETAAETSDFRGTIGVSTTDAIGVLQVSEGDAIIATYEDADDGTGAPATVTDEAAVDCTPPVIFNVQVIDIEPRRAIVTFDTDEPASGAVRYGDSCGNLSEFAAQSGLGLEHSVIISGLTDDSTYYFIVEAADEAGNPASDDNGGSCYAFTTPDIPNYFTEMFGSNDLDNLTLTFSPNGTFDYYAGCTEEIDELPTDPAGGTSITLSDDDYEAVNIGGGETVSLYGDNYSTFYVGSNGYITFGSGETDYTESLEDHFSLPRIAALYDDLNPSSGGTVSWKQEDDRVAVTYLNVPEFSSSNQNTFQIEMYFNGDITISYLDIAATDGLAGLSGGNGLDPDYYATDLSDMGSCGPKPPIAQNGSIATTANTPVTVTLIATDDDLPEPPALTYIIASLPNNGVLIDPAAALIESTPYTLAEGGNQVIYRPGPWHYGSDSFTFMANDGGVPPEGGNSNEALISLEISLPDPELALSFPLDTDPGWAAEGEWAFGQPAGAGTHNRDPGAGFTGVNVYGYNLNGDYSTDMPEYFLTTAALDCSLNINTELRFMRWLGVERAPFDQAGVEISADGLDWTTLWTNPAVNIADLTWSQMTFDISAIADGEPTVYIRWKMGETDDSTTYPGWNIDDIELWAVVMTPICPGDLDNDGDVDLADLAQLLSNYGMTSGAEPDDGDLDNDGDVDLADLAALLAVYGDTCE